MSAHWDDLKTVMHLVRGGSLATAAEALGVSYTTVARRVKRVEDDLGIKLFERMADGYQATDAGQVVAQKASAMEVEEHDLMRNLLGADQTIRGSLTITAPQLVCSTHLAPVLHEFTDRYPEVDVQIRADNEVLDLNRREADLAIRVSDNPGDNLMGRRLTEVYSAVYATRDWVDRIKSDPNQPVDWLHFHDFKTIPADLKEALPNLKTRATFDDFIALVGSARKGLGLVHMPIFLGHEYPELVRVPYANRIRFADIWAVAHRDVWRSARVTAFREILIPYFRAHEAEFIGTH